MCLSCVANGPESIAGVPVATYFDNVISHTPFVLYLCDELQACLLRGLYQFGITPDILLRKEVTLAQALWKRVGLDFEYTDGMDSILLGKFLDQGQSLLGAALGWGAFGRVGGDDSRHYWHPDLVAAPFATADGVKLWMREQRSLERIPHYTPNRVLEGHIASSQTFKQQDTCLGPPETPRTPTRQRDISSSTQNPVTTPPQAFLPQSPPIPRTPRTPQSRRQIQYRVQSPEEARLSNTVVTYPMRRPGYALDGAYNPRPLGLNPAPRRHRRYIVDERPGFASPRPVVPCGDTGTGPLFGERFHQRSTSGDTIEQPHYGIINGIGGMGSFEALPRDMDGVRLTDPEQLSNPHGLPAAPLRVNPVFSFTMSPPASMRGGTSQTALTSPVVTESPSPPSGLAPSPVRPRFRAEEDDQMSPSAKRQKTIIELARAMENGTPHIRVEAIFPGRSLLSTCLCLAAHAAPMDRESSICEAYKTFTSFWRRTYSMESVQQPVPLGNFTHTVWFRNLTRLDIAYALRPPPLHWEKFTYELGIEFEYGKSLPVTSSDPAMAIRVRLVAPSNHHPMIDAPAEKESWIRLEKYSRGCHDHRQKLARTPFGRVRVAFDEQDTHDFAQCDVRGLTLRSSGLCLSDPIV
ncbi:hypothetical protein G7046_g5749 [Stylonectria norvegica]|nr:hypothetical protein G7046_g5749 [Stylonectria norvegica]